MIKLEKACKTYTVSGERRVAAVRDVTLTISPGEFVVLTGRSGSGKTTLLNLIAGLTPPTAGRVLWDDTDLWGLTDRERSLLRNRKVGFVFQFPSLLPSLTVLENVMLPTIFGGHAIDVDAQVRAHHLLATVGLSEKLDVYPRQLSAGQQQRVVVARALFNQPEILLADEPTSDLDERTETEIMDLFQEIHEESAVTVVMVTHTSQLIRYGTRAIQMTEGQVIEECQESARLAAAE